MTTIYKLSPDVYVDLDSVTFLYWEEGLNCAWIEIGLAGAPTLYAHYDFVDYKKEVTYRHGQLALWPKSTTETRLVECPIKAAAESKKLKTEYFEPLVAAWRDTRRLDDK